MTVTLRKPNSRAYHEFANDVKQRAQRDYNYSYVSNEVSNSSPFFAVLLFLIFFLRRSHELLADVWLFQTNMDHLCAKLKRLYVAAYLSAIFTWTML